MSKPRLWILCNDQEHHSKCMPKLKCCIGYRARLCPVQGSTITFAEKAVLVHMALMVRASSNATSSETLRRTGRENMSWCRMSRAMFECSPNVSIDYTHRSHPHLWFHPSEDRRLPFLSSLSTRKAHDCTTIYRIKAGIGVNRKRQLGECLFRNRFPRLTSGRREKILLKRKAHCRVLGNPHYVSET